MIEALEAVAKPLTSFALLFIVIAAGELRCFSCLPRDARCDSMDAGRLLTLFCLARPNCATGWYLVWRTALLKLRVFQEMVGLVYVSGLWQHQCLLVNCEAHYQTWLPLPGCRKPDKPLRSDMQHRIDDIRVRYAAFRAAVREHKRRPWYLH